MRLGLVRALHSAPPHTQSHAGVFPNQSNAGLLMRQSKIRVSSIGCVPAMAINSLRTKAGSREGTNSCGGRDSGGVAVLDMGDYFCDEVGARERFAVDLREQCHTVGLFYVKNHGVSLVLCEEMLASARKFFELPACVKNELDYSTSPQFRGYMKIGVENTAGLVDFREQIEFGPEENAELNSDGSGNTAVHPVFLRLRGPNQWPPAAQIPEFRPTAMEFMDEMNSVSMHLMQALASSLGLDHDFFDSTFLPSAHYQMKVARYPPKPTEDGNAGVGVFGVGPHSDTGFLSLLLQDNVGGLQARALDGKWIDVPPMEGTLVVNLGEMLQLATHGYYLATVHRVLSLPGTRSRYSIPFFFNPCLEAEVKRMPGMAMAVVETGTPLLKEWRDESPLSKVVVDAGESTTHGGRNKLHRVFGMNAFKSFARSHPRVVETHHSDLLDAHGDLVLERILG